MLNTTRVLPIGDGRDFRRSWLSFYLVMTGTCLVGCEYMSVGKTLGR
jgi:hypothetical protein